MRLLIAFDDTDNLNSPGTGHLLEDFRTLAGQMNWGPTRRISRHQLYVHPDVPYTSHNSAMCFEMVTKKELVDILEKKAVEFLTERAAEGSDPGLCILEMDRLTDSERLIRFGKRAKKEVLSKSLAYDTAEACRIRLSEHGGTGDGIIGALAGTGLRLDGNDGRFRGQLEGLEPGDSLDSETLLSHPHIDRIALLEPHENLPHLQYTEETIPTILLQDKPKTILMNGESLFLVYNDRRTQTFRNWTRQELKRF